MKRFASQALKVAAALLVLTGIAYFFVKHERQQQESAGRRPNILLLSFCSLRWQHLQAFNPEARPLPALDRFFNESLIFANAVNGLPWTNVTNYIETRDLQTMGYSHARRKSVRMPLVPIHKSNLENDRNESLDFRKFQVRNYELNYADGFESLKKMLMNATNQEYPFYISAHIKYMHFPVIDSVNQKDLWRSELSEGNVRRLTRYLERPSQYPEKAALILTLFADPELVKGNPLVNKYIADDGPVQIGQIYQVLSDKNLLEQWKKSEGYNEDLAILDEAYYLKLRNLDSQLKEVLNLYGLRELKKNTIVIVSGDHGESLMENGRFLHANDIHEEQIRFPLAVRPLGGTRKTVIHEQFEMSMQNKLVQYAADNNLGAEDLIDYIQGQGESVYVRNCRGTVDGVRFQNRYKFVSDASGYRLYDLKQDPGQQIDIRASNSDMFFKLKEIFLQLSKLPRSLLACEEDARGR